MKTIIKIQYIIIELGKYFTVEIVLLICKYW